MQCGVCIRSYLVISVEPKTWHVEVSPQLFFFVMSLLLFLIRYMSKLVDVLSPLWIHLRKNCHRPESTGTESVRTSFQTRYASSKPFFTFGPAGLLRLSVPYSSLLEKMPCKSLRSTKARRQKRWRCPTCRHCDSYTARRIPRYRVSGAGRGRVYYDRAEQTGCGTLPPRCLVRMIPIILSHLGQMIDAY